MTKPKQEEALFSDEPGREYDSAKKRTWKEEGLEESRAQLHEPDMFSHQDDLGLRTMGEVRREVSGMSRDEALRRVTAQAARNVMSESFEQAARAKEIARQKAEQQRAEEIKNLLSDHPVTDEAA